MHLDFEVQRSTRCCAATERALEPGDICFSVLVADGANVVRKDYSTDGWKGPPEKAIGWWKSRVPDASSKKIKLAPNDVLLQLFDQFADQPDSEEMRYVLALLLMRRRVLRVETPLDFTDAADGQKNGDVESLVLYCPKRDASYHVAVAMPTGERINEIQRRLGEWLIAGSE